MKIISGGQTGVDRAALDAAMEAGIPCGGWCPKGRRSEDRRIPDRYPLQETASAEYPVRTGLNVAVSDATLILIDQKADRGTKLTEALCRKNKKKVLLIDLAATGTPAEFALRLCSETRTSSGLSAIENACQWLKENKVQILNVAGNRESFSPGIGNKTRKFLLELFGKSG